MASCSISRFGIGGIRRYSKCTIEWSWLPGVWVYDYLPFHYVENNLVGWVHPWELMNSIISFAPISAPTCANIRDEFTDVVLELSGATPIAVLSIIVITVHSGCWNSCSSSNSGNNSTTVVIHSIIY